MDRTLLITVFAITIICAILQLPQFQAITIWDARLIKQGEYWRLLSGNFTHTNAIHLAMNMAALWIISYLFRPSILQFVLFIIVCSLFIGVSLLYSDLDIYAGLSGVLHGIFAFYALQEALGARRSSWLLVFGLVVKIAYEQWFGAAQSTELLINAKVALGAHLAGSVFGLFTAVITRIRKAF